MIDHIALEVTKPSISRNFYERALAPLGYRVRLEIPLEETDGRVVLGLGDVEKPDFWLIEGTPNKPPLHVAFTAQTSADVDTFYQSALAAGGKDNGPPGPRPHYHKTYYGAFVLDPDGHNIEAVYHSYTKS